MTYLIVRAIEHWDDNIELVLDNFTHLDDKIMPSRRSNGKAKDDIKTKIIYIDMLCTSKIASDTFESVKKQARNDVTLQIRSEVECWNSAPVQTQGEITIALKSDQDIYNFMNLPNISNSVEFASHLFQLYWRQILVNMHPIVFGERYYDAYDDQKNYLKNEICKPCGMASFPLSSFGDPDVSMTGGDKLL